MSLNDERERLDMAEKYLIDYAANTQEFEAALEHIRWTYKNKPEWRPRCEAIIKNVAAEADRRREHAKLKELTK